MNSVNRQVQRAARVVREGGVVGYPSETVWGLGVAPQFASVLSARKGREAGKPLQLSCADPRTALTFCEPSAPLLALLALLPGPLTVVTPGRAGVPDQVAPAGRVGVRVPDHALALALLRETGPLLTTSLNPAGAPAARSYQEAEVYGLADTLLGSVTDRAGGLASTVVQLPAEAGTPARILRLGAYPVAPLREALAETGVELLGSEWREDRER